ncbi:MAG TPA: hypothetical protein VGK00_11970 [Anaerolineales bacterium]|jgi:hypothetical protein
MLSFLVLASLGCNAVTRLVSPDDILPALMTVAPTALEAVETSAAEMTPPVAATTGPAGAEKSPESGLGISLKSVRPILEGTQQFTFTDGTVGGQPAVITSLSPSAGTSMPGLTSNFSVAFIGNPDNLGQIRITSPYSDNQAEVDAGLGMLTVVFAAILPPDVLLSFLPWLSENYSKVPEGGSEEMTAKNMKFTLSRFQTQVQLDIVPAK